MSEKKLREYQIKAIDGIIEFYKNKSINKGKIFISTGLGKSIIILSVIERILNSEINSTVLYLSLSCAMCEQLRHFAIKETQIKSIANNIKKYNNQGLIITTYQDLLSNYKDLDMSSIKMVICDEANTMKTAKYDEIFKLDEFSCVGIMSNPYYADEGWFEDSVCFFEYTIDNAIEDGYLQRYDEKALVENIVVPLLKKQGYAQVHRGGTGKININLKSEIDLLAEKDNSTFILEVKAYRGVQVSTEIINNAINQILKYKKDYIKYTSDNCLECILVMFCKIDQSIKHKVLEKFNLVIWDISNLIYLCEEEQLLMDKLTQYLSYPILEVEAAAPLIHLPYFVDKRHEAIIGKVDYAVKLIESLRKCQSGNKEGNDRKYEVICTEIIKYLFDSEFTRISPQHKTNDEMFRMDLLCSIKGNSVFWEFLINFYHTKFVVFEYKNYENCITQNLVYITEKYLFPIALRNVAFIISRKGFDKNAYNASIGCLRENGKLIISLNDDDFIHMIEVKADGGEPSDYLLDKVELLLMSVSK